MLNKIVGYIRSAREFPFSVEDVEEDLDAVLEHFGFSAELTGDEQQQLSPWAN